MISRCNPCGKGTRCHQCTWLVVYCKRDYPDELGENEFEIPYKLPYIEMWEEVIEGINAGNYTNDELGEIFKSNQKALAKDCKSCEYLQLKKIKILAKKSAKKVRKENSNVKAKNIALKNAEKILKYFQDLPLSLVGIVDEDASLQFNYR